MDITATRTEDVVNTDRMLATYLRDHAAGAVAGEALARRCHKSNADTPFGAVLADIAAEIAEDRRTLAELMRDLDVSPSRVKGVIGAVAEFVGRLKSNGRLVRYSPSSRVVELEALAAGVLTKRNLWRSLSGAAAQRPELDAEQLDILEQRATTQLDRLLEAHRRAAATAFARPS